MEEYQKKYFDYKILEGMKAREAEYAAYHAMAT
jgi:hypothetical protein